MIDKFAKIRELCEESNLIVNITGVGQNIPRYFISENNSLLEEYLCEARDRQSASKIIDAFYAIPELLDALDKAKVALEFYRHQGNYLYDAPVEGDGLSDKGERARQCYEDIWGTE